MVKVNGAEGLSCEMADFGHYSINIDVNKSLRASIAVAVAKFSTIAHRHSYDRR